MKLKFLFTTLVAAAGFLSAGAQNSNDIVVQAGDAKNLSIGSNMHVVLVPTTKASASFSLNEEATQNLHVSLNGSTLALHRANVDRQTVYVMVNDLQHLSIASDVLVETKGVLKAPLITVSAEADAKAILRTVGKVRAESDFDVVVKVTSVGATSPDRASL